MLRVGDLCHFKRWLSDEFHIGVVVGEPPVSPFGYYRIRDFTDHEWISIDEHIILLIACYEQLVRGTFRV
jgi:hypothetical protein